MPLPGLDVLEGSGTAQVKDVLAHSTVAGSPSLSARQMGQPVLHLHPFSEPCSARRRLHQFVQSLLERFILGNAHHPSVLGLSRRALGTQRALAAYLRIEFHDSPRLEGQPLASWTRHGPTPHVQLEDGLG